MQYVWKFNMSLSNGTVSFEEPGPGDLGPVVQN